RGISSARNSDTPRKSESLQALFWATTRLCPKPSRVFGGLLRPERRTHVFCCYPTPLLENAPREDVRHGPPSSTRSQRQGQDHAPGPRSLPQDGQRQGLRTDH